jgi:hypothetical protein
MGHAVYCLGKTPGQLPQPVGRDGTTHHGSPEQALHQTAHHVEAGCWFAGVLEASAIT